MSNINSGTKEVQNELIITRIFDAPRELVWKAWTNPEYIKQWWGPKEYTSPFSAVDLKVGGKNLFCMKSKKDGTEIWSTGIYKEIIPNEKLVFSNCFADEKGNVVSAAHYGMDGNIPIEMIVTVILEDHDGKTKMTLTHAGLPQSESEGANIGWNESLDKLADCLN